MYNGLTRTVEDIVNTVGDLLMEYQNTSKAFSTRPKPLAVTSKVWLAPPPGSLKRIQMLLLKMERTLLALVLL